MRNGYRVIDVDTHVAPSINYSGPITVGPLRAYKKQQPVKRILIERHPLWGDDHPVWLNSVSEAAAQFPGYEIRHVNPFLMLRRPADYV